MANIVLVALVQVSALGAEQQGFDQAYHESLTTGRPLVVLVGAGWCPACQKMSKSILPQVAESGGLNKVVFTYVDFDQQRQLASRLSRGGPIPQLIRFDRTPAGWSRKHLIGARSRREVHDFINAGLRDEGQVSKVSTMDQPRDDSRKPAPGETLRSTPAASNSGPRSLVNATGHRQREVSSFPLEKTAGLSHWMTLLKRLSRPSGNPRGGTTFEPNQSRQAREDREASQSTGPREAGRDGPALGGSDADIAGALSTLVSGR
jgi:thiol-disulfide isomerase/thioredoxin